MSTSFLSANVLVQNSYVLRGLMRLATEPNIEYMEVQHMQYQKRKANTDIKLITKWKGGSDSEAPVAQAPIRVFLFNDALSNVINIELSTSLAHGKNWRPLAIIQVSKMCLRICSTTLNVRRCKRWGQKSPHAGTNRYYAQSGMRNQQD